MGAIALLPSPSTPHTVLPASGTPPAEDRRRWRRANRILAEALVVLARDELEERRPQRRLAEDQPTDKDLRAVLDKIVRRVLEMLTRRGALVQEQDATCVADADGESDAARALRKPQAADCSGR